MLEGILDLVIDQFITSRKINIIMIILNLAHPSMIKLNIITLITKPSNHSIKSLFCTSHHMHLSLFVSLPLLSHMTRTYIFHAYHVYVFHGSCSSFQRIDELI